MKKILSVLFVLFSISANANWADYMVLSKTNKGSDSILFSVKVCDRAIVGSFLQRVFKTSSIKPIDCVPYSKTEKVLKYKVMLDKFNKTKEYFNNSYDENIYQCSLTLKVLSYTLFSKKKYIVSQVKNNDFLFMGQYKFTPEDPLFIMDNFSDAVDVVSDTAVNGDSLYEMMVDLTELSVEEISEKVISNCRF